jgi:sulfate transport system ATP-binding protein
MSIEVKHVSKTFGNHKALSDVTLKVDDGELVALLGPSGSGKTTLLRIIAGLETADDDPRTQILFHGNEVSRSDVAHRRVGFVFQHYALFRHMTVADNIAFGLRVRPRGTRPERRVIAQRVQELLQLIQLENFGNRFPSQLSGGQRQRVALARALAIEPRVLLLDEPFGALDAKVRKGLRDWLRRLHDRLQMTTVLVTHDQEEALEVSDRVVVMNQAVIEQAGTPAEVFHHPATEFVMDFLGQVNVFHGRVEHGRALIGGASIVVKGVPEGSASDTALYVRPHDFEIDRRRNGSAAITANVLRVNPAGATAKISLAAADGKEFHAELPLDRFRELSLTPGDEVYVSPKNVRIFAPDYAI